MRLLFAGDGPRDKAFVPAFVERLIGLETGTLEPQFYQWKELRKHRGSGYGPKLKLLLADARTNGFKGVVCTVDQDAADPRDRLGALQSARNEDRAQMSLVPVAAAFGEARPHLEAWIINDSQALRIAFNADEQIKIPNLKPKEAFDEVCNAHGVTEGRDRCKVLTSIAHALDLERCMKDKPSGLKAFAEEVRQELRSAHGD